LAAAGLWPALRARLTFAMALLSACPDTESLESLSPQIELGEEALSFGAVRVGGMAQLSLPVAACSRRAQ